ERPHVLGRVGKLDLLLDDEDVSRRHVEIFRKGSQIFVRDLGSKNGTRLGERTLESGKEAVWPPGTPLFVGNDRLEYEDPVAAALEELERAVDERMREDDSVDPPLADEPPEAAPEEDVGAGEPLPRDARAAPIAAVPGRAGATRPEKTGWTSTDWMVALIALFVLAASALGLLWLFGGS